MGRRFRRLQRLAQQVVQITRKYFRICLVCGRVEQHSKTDVVSVEKLFSGNFSSQDIARGECTDCERQDDRRQVRLTKGWESPEESPRNRSESDWESPKEARKRFEFGRGTEDSTCVITDVVPNAGADSSRNVTASKDFVLPHDLKDHPLYNHSTWDTWYSSYPLGWKVEKSLLDGNFGQTSVVSDCTDTSYVLKIRDGDKRAMEVSHLADLQCRFVSRLMTSFVRENQRFTFTEYCPLGDLKHWLEMDRDRTHFKEDVAVDISATLYVAVGFLHDAGVLHLNVNTSNVLINHYGNPILCGFGNARAIRNCQSVTLESEYPMTSTYIPPERFQGRPPNKMTDFWSVACCLYEIIKGKSPFVGKSQVETQLNISLAIVPDMEGLTPDAHQFISSALHLSWQHRLGFEGDILTVCRHRLFDNINWEYVAQSGFVGQTSNLFRICDTLSKCTNGGLPKLATAEVQHADINAAKGDGKKEKQMPTFQSDVNCKKAQHLSGLHTKEESSDSQSHDSFCNRRASRRKRVGRGRRPRGRVLPRQPPVG